MSDLAERLRRMADMTTIGNDLADIGRAADEIERLRRHIQIHAGDTQSLSNEIDMWRERALEAEQQLADARNQLVTAKAALEEIRSIDSLITRGIRDLGPCAEIAEATLFALIDDLRQEPKGVYGEMCRDPKICAGKGYCPRDPGCCE